MISTTRKKFRNFTRVEILFFSVAEILINHRMHYILKMLYSVRKNTDCMGVARIFQRGGHTGKDLMHVDSDSGVFAT